MPKSFIGQREIVDAYVGDQRLVAMYVGKHLVWNRDPFSFVMRGGVYELSGLDATLTIHYDLSAGLFALTGEDLGIGFSSGLDTGIFTLAGVTWAGDVTFNFDQASFAETGFDLTASIFTGLVTSSFVLTGEPLNHARIFSFGQGSFVETGESLIAERIASLSQGSFALTGEPMAPTRISTSLAQGSFTLTGEAMTGTNLTPVVSYVGSPAVQTANTSPYTFTANTGTASADRKSQFNIFWENSSTPRTLNSVTIDNGDGSGAHTMTITDQQHPASQGGCAQAYLANTFGTTATVVVTFSSAPLGCAMDSYEVHSSQSTPLDHGSAQSATPANVADIEVSVGGGLIVALAGNSNVNLTASYNGIDTPVAGLALSTRLEVSACPIGSWYISNITENITTNDPGGSGPLNVRACATSWAP